MAETFRVFQLDVYIQNQSIAGTVNVRIPTVADISYPRIIILEYLLKLALRFTAVSLQANVQYFVTNDVIFHLFESARSANSISILKQFQNPNRVRIKAPSWLRNLKARFPLGAAIVNRRLRFVGRSTTSC